MYVCKCHAITDDTLSTNSSACSLLHLCHTIAPTLYGSFTFSPHYCTAPTRAPCVYTRICIRVSIAPSLSFAHAHSRSPLLWGAAATADNQITSPFLTCTLYTLYVCMCTRCNATNYLCVLR